MRPRHVPVTSRFFAFVLALTIVLGGSSAKADQLDENMTRPWPTEKKVVVLTLLGASVLSMSYMVYSMVQQENATATIKDAPRTTSGSADCVTLSKCGELAAARHDIGAWGDRMNIGGAVGVGLGLSALAAAVLWPTGSTRVVPAASQQGASLSVVGEF
ncbi:hypothetical protein BH11MYX4_BH11MYX4_22570 [soil metagenome]